MKRVILFALLFQASLYSSRLSAQPATLHVGFGETNVTPALDAKKPVFLAGFGKNRKATRVHDPLMARAVVLQAGKTRIPLATGDLLRLFPEPLLPHRPQLPGFSHFLVSRTHNPAAPDPLSPPRAS